MAKRFTDSDKFTDPWYRRLSTKNKLMWDWMLCSCDHAGFISIDIEFVEMVLGERFEDDVVEKHFSDRVLKMGPFKYFIPKFIKFQYGELNPDSRVHKSVIKKLSEHGIDFTKLDTLSILYPYPIDTLKDKDKNKDSSFLSLKESNTELVIINPPKSEAEQVLSHWNSLVEGNGHEGTKIQIKKISEALKKLRHDFSLEQIKQGVSNYFTVLYGEEYFYSYQFNCWDFLSRKNNLNFMPGLFTPASYLGFTSKIDSRKSSKQSHRTQSAVSDAEIEEARQLGIL